jgi:hypothetical protein
MPQSAVEHAGPIDLFGSIEELAIEICRLTGYRRELAHRSIRQDAKAPVWPKPSMQ